MVATVYWTGHESESWYNGGTAVGATTAGGNYDANFSRSAATIGVTPIQWSPPQGNVAERWFRMRASQYFGTSGLTVNIVEFRNSSGQGCLRLRSVSGSTLELQYWNGSVWTLIGSAVNATAALNDKFIDIVCKINNTTGWFGWWIDGTKQYEMFNVDTDLFGGSAVDSVWLAAWNQFNGSAVSELILADGETLGMRCATLAPTGTGATTGWTSGTFADVDEAVVNDADMISSNTAAQVDTFAMSNLSATAALLIPVAVKVGMRARNSAVVPQNLQAALRVAGTDYFGSNIPGLTTSFQNLGFGTVWNLSPATGLPFTVSEINAAEGGAKSIT